MRSRGGVRGASAGAGHRAGRRSNAARADMLDPVAPTHEMVTSFRLKRRAVRDRCWVAGVGVDVPRSPTSTGRTLALGRKRSALNSPQSANHAKWKISTARHWWWNTRNENDILAHTADDKMFAVPPPPSRPSAPARTRAARAHLPARALTREKAKPVATKTGKKLQDESMEEMSSIVAQAFARTARRCRRAHGASKPSRPTRTSGCTAFSRWRSGARRGGAPSPRRGTTKAELEAKG